MIASLKVVGTRLLTRPTPDRLDFLNFAVTYRCNSRCTTCDIWKIRDHADLTLEEVRAIVEGSQALSGLSHVALTGGEPFLRDDLAGLALLFLRRYPDLRLTIPTNALAPARVMETLRKVLEGHGRPAHPIFLSVSLDGMGETHDRVRGMPGNFEKAVRVLEETETLAPAVERGISFTIVRDNFRDLRPAYEFARERGIVFGFQFAAVSETYYSKADISALRLTLEEVREVETVIRGIAEERAARLRPLRRLLAAEQFFASRMTGYYRRPRRLAPCWSGTHSAFLGPRGDLFPCIMLARSYGNVRERPFDEVWFGPVAEVVRRSIAARECHCWTSCEAIPSLLRDIRVPLSNGRRLALSALAGRTA